MAGKSNKENTPKKAVSQKSTDIKKSSAKPGKTADDEELSAGDEEAPKKGKKSVSLKSSDDFGDDLDDIEEDEDESIKQDDDDWDPDFNEFDLPKSSKKTPLKKGAKDLDDDFKIDDEFKDYFGSTGSKKYSSRDDDDDY